MMSTQHGQVAKSRIVRKKVPDNTVLKTDDSIKDQIRNQIIERKNKLHSFADRLAGSTFHYRNWYFKEGKEAFPQQDNLRYVAKMYPFADDGMLLIDEPRFEHELRNCEIKRQTLLELGYHYVVIKQGMTFTECAEELAHVLDYCSRRVKNTIK